MNLHNPVYALALTALVLVLAAITLKFSGFYRTLLSDEANRARFLALDGLRGLCAFGVVLHHATISFRFHAGDGAWTLPASRFYALLGQGGVAGFFLLTAFLFWRKALRSPSQINAVNLLGGRMRRIAPAYVVSTLMIIVAAMWKTDWTLQVPPLQWLREVVNWFGFGFLPMSPINGWSATPVLNAMVYWTLPYEWLFYICLPLGAAMLTLPLSLRILALIWLCAISLSWQIISIYFVLGAAAAWLQSKTIVRTVCSGWVGALISGAALITFFTYSDTAYEWSSALLLFAFFAPIAAGQSFAGVLTTRPLLLLGCVSYSLYLFHGIVLFALGSTGGFSATPWLTAAVATVLVFFLSCVSYRWVEYPFLKPTT